MGRDHRPMRGLVLGKLWQVEKHDIRRTEYHGTGQCDGARIAGRQVIGCAILVDGFNTSPIGISDGHEAQLDLAAVMHQPDHIGGVQRQP